MTLVKEGDEWLWDGPKRGTGRAIKKSLLIDALMRCEGVPYQAALMLGCAEWTVYKHIKEDPDLAAIVEASSETSLDMSNVVIRSGLKEYRDDKRHALECAKMVIKHATKRVLKSRFMACGDEDKSEIDTQITITRLPKET
jgi:hypothetical protein